MNVNKHPALSGLRHLGPPHEVARRIETELAMAGQKARAGPIWLTSSWLVVLTPTLLIHSARELIGVGYQTEGNRLASNTSFALGPRKVVPKNLEVSEAEANTGDRKSRSVHSRLIVTGRGRLRPAVEENRAKCEQEKRPATGATSDRPDPVSGGTELQVSDRLCRANHCAENSARRSFVSVQ